MSVIQDQSQQQLIQAKLTAQGTSRSNGQGIDSPARNGNHDSKSEPTGRDGSQPRQPGTALKIKNQIYLA